MPTRRTSPRRTAIRPTVIHEPMDDDEPPTGRLASAAPWLALLALVAALGAVAFVVLGRGTDMNACRTAAWSAIPDKSNLPGGWTLGSTDLNANGMTVSILGPTPADTTTTQPVVYASVTCYGDASAAAMRENRIAAKAAGSTVTDRIAGGDAYDVDNLATGSVTTLFRVGTLVGQVADAGSAGQSDLLTITSAVAAAMGDGTAAGTGGAVPSDQALASQEPLPSEDTGSGAPEPSAVAPELEALLPTEIAGTPLTVQSGLASDGIGNDPNSRALAAALRDESINLSDVQIASAADPDQTLDLSVFGFRLLKGDVAKLQTAILKSWLSSGAAGVKTTTVQLNGKSLTKIDYGDQGPTDYVYRGADYVIVIETADTAIATEVAGKLK